MQTQWSISVSREIIRVGVHQFATGARWLLVPVLFGALHGAFGAEIEGFTEPSKTIDLAAPEPGVLARLLVEEGDEVAAGAMVAQLDNRVLDATRKTSHVLANATARMRAAQVQKGLSDMRLQRLQELAGSGSARGDELAVARAEADKAAADVAAAEESRQYEQLRLAEIDARIAERTLHSPLAGVVTRVHHDVGEFIGASAMQTVTIVQLDPLHLTLFVPPTQSVQFVKGRTMPIICAAASAARTAKIDFVSPVIEPESGTRRVVLSVPNSDRALNSGIRCHATLADVSAQPMEPAPHE